MQQLMTLEELATHLNVRPRTVYEWVARKRIPYTKVGSLLRFPVDLIGKWQEKRTFIPATIK